MAKIPKAPKIFIKDGAAALALRKKLGLNQFDFWTHIRVTQSGGSRYESGRKIPHAVQLMLHFAYAPEDQALAMLTYLRLWKETE